MTDALPVRTNEVVSQETTDVAIEELLPEARQTAVEEKVERDRLRHFTSWTDNAAFY